MHTAFFKIGSFTIHWYGVMMALGFLAALLNWHFLGKKEGRRLDYCSDLLFWIMLSGIIGARIAYVASNFRYFIDNPAEIIRIDRGGLIYYGGFLAAGGAIVVFARVHKEKISGLFDFVITAVPLAHAFGRIGCFLHGCCFGKVCHSFPAVRFPITSPAAWKHHAEGLIANERVERLMTAVKDWRMSKSELTEKVRDLVESGAISRTDALSLPVHPVQLYESALNIFIYILLIQSYRHRQSSGRTLALYLISYPIVRFSMEFLRGDERMRYAGLTLAQIISAGLFALGIVFFLYSRKKGNSGPPHE